MISFSSLTFPYAELRPCIFLHENILELFNLAQINHSMLSH